MTAVTRQQSAEERAHTDAAIDKAVAAERERCIAIIEYFPSAHSGLPTYSTVKDACEALVNRIRRPG